jgi:hypothetical protein
VHIYPCDSPQEFYGARNRSEIEPDRTALAEMAKRLAF